VLEANSAPKVLWYSTTKFDGLKGQSKEPRCRQMRPQNLLVITILCFGLILGSLHLTIPYLYAQTSSFVAKVVGVSDGDTLTVRSSDETLTIRLYGIDAPETHQPFSTKAKQLVSDLAFGQAITVHPYRYERFNRLIAKIELSDGRDLGEELVRQGLAWWYEQYAPKDQTLKRLEQDAKTQKRGLWVEPNPIPPWNYRRTGDEPPETLPPVFGNSNSKIFHPKGCPSYIKIAPENRVPFASIEEAKTAGYRATRDCGRLE